MFELSIPDIIKIGDVSTYLSANYEEDGTLFGERLSTTSPQTIQLVTDALRWQWEAFPTIPEVRATGTITIDTVGDVGDAIQVFVNDPILGVISLGYYQLDASDTTLGIIATHIGAALTNNPYGYAISVANNIITIIAAQGLGSTINGGNNISYIITTPDFLTTESNIRIITENSVNLIA